MDRDQRKESLIESFVQLPLSIQKTHLFYLWKSCHSCDKFLWYDTKKTRFERALGFSSIEDVTKEHWTQVWLELVNRNQLRLVLVFISTLNSCRLMLSQEKPYRDTFFSSERLLFCCPIWCVHRSPPGIALATNGWWWRGLNRRPPSMGGWRATHWATIPPKSIM